MSERTVLVTGAGSGIGAVTAKTLARHGENVLIVDINQAAADEVAEQIKAEGGQATAYACDVSSHQNLSELFSSIQEDWGVLDCAVNNAGITGSIGPLDEVSPKDVESIISVNLLSVLYCMQFELAMMKRSSRGAIVNTCSMWGVTGMANYTAYSASKHGVAGATKSAALEVAAHQIRVNAVCPGMIRTPMNQRLALEEDQAALRPWVARHPMGRIGEPQEIADGVAFLLSDKASFITGQLLSIDGGYVVQ